MTDTKTRKLSVVRTPVRRRSASSQGEVVHVGVDVHKATYHVALLSDRRGLLATWVQPARPELLLERLAPVREADRPGRLRGRAHRLRPGPPPPGRGLPRPGHRPLEASLAPVGPEAKSDRLDCRRLAISRPEGPAAPGPRPHRAGGGRPPGAAAPRAAGPQGPLGPAADQGVPAAARHRRAGRAWPTGRSGPSRRCARLELLPELRFCLDVMLDELEHAQEQVERVTERLEELARGRAAPDGGRGDADGAGGGADHGDDLPPGAARAGAVRPRRPGGADGRAGPAGPPERRDPPRGRAAEVGQRPAADGPGGGGLEVGRRRRGGQGGATAGWWATPAAARRRSWRWRGGWGCCCGG